MKVTKILDEYHCTISCDNCSASSMIKIQAELRKMLLCYSCLYKVHEQIKELVGIKTAGETQVINLPADSQHT